MSKLICNNCPRVKTCNAVVEWFDPKYSMATYIEGIGFDIRLAPKDNICPYSHEPTQAELEDIFRPE